MKLTDKEFWQILEENDGFFARTAKAIHLKYGVSYSRQAVRERALSNPDKLNDIIQSSLDESEAALFDLRNSKDERIKFEAVRFILLTRGKSRGYVIKQEHAVEQSGRVEHSVSFEQWKKIGDERIREATETLLMFQDSTDDETEN